MLTTAYDSKLAGPPLTIYTDKYSDTGESRVTFDAQCDLAAVVYGPDDDPDRLFIDFADDLNRSGRRTIGLIQVGRSCRSNMTGGSE